jgi:hypothetical protein
MSWDIISAWMKPTSNRAVLNSMYFNFEFEISELEIEICNLRIKFEI